VSRTLTVMYACLPYDPRPPFPPFGRRPTVLPLDRCTRRSSLPSPTQSPPQFSNLCRCTWHDVYDRYDQRLYLSSILVSCCTALRISRVFPYPRRGSRHRDDGREGLSSHLSHSGVSLSCLSCSGHDVDGQLPVFTHEYKCTMAFFTTITDEHSLINICVTDRRH